MFADGGTSPDKGLKYAYDKLVNNKREDIPQYVILFTDGEPTGNGGSWSNDAASKAKTQAEKLKEEGVIIYTVGLGLTDKTKGWLDGTLPIWYEYKNISGIASKGCALTAESIDDFKKSFNRFLIISLDVLICRYSPLLRAFPALFISEEPHKSFYYPSCFHSQK